MIHGQPFGSLEKMDSFANNQLNSIIFIVRLFFVNHCWFVKSSLLKGLFSITVSYEHARCLATLDFHSMYP